MSIVLNWNKRGQEEWTTVSITTNTTLEDLKEYVVENKIVSPATENLEQI